MWDLETEIFLKNCAMVMYMAYVPMFSNENMYSVQCYTAAHGLDCYRCFH